MSHGLFEFGRLQAGERVHALLYDVQQRKIDELGCGHKALQVLPVN